MHALRRPAAALVASATIVSAAGPAYDAGTARRLIQSALNGRAYEYTRQLTEIGPRLTGSASYERSVDWSVQQFNALGLGSVRRERFSVARTWERERAARGRILAPIQQPLLMASLGWAPSTPDGGIEADLAIVSIRSGFDPDDVRGRVVLVDAEDGGDFERRLVSAGAAALLFQDADGDNELAARVRRFGGGIAPLPAATIARDDVALMRRLAKDGPVRIAIDWRNRISDGPVAVNSVVAEMRGRERPDEWVLAGAHLDSWDFASGAQDNATGVAMVVEAARAIAGLGKAPRRSIRFALWGGEEQGLLGSSAYVEAHADQLDRAVAVLNVDGGTGRILGWTTPGRADVQAEVTELARALLRDLDAVRVDRGMTYAFDSDGAPFLREGIPVLDLKVDDSRYEEIHHKSTDRLDRVDARNLAIGAAAVAVTAYVIADAPRRIVSRGPRLTRH
jgi:Iap family predicted aminopeptidase